MASAAVSSADSAGLSGTVTIGVVLSNSAVSGSRPSAKIVSIGVRLGNSVSMPLAYCAEYTSVVAV